MRYRVSGANRSSNPFHVQCAGYSGMFDSLFNIHDLSLLIEKMRQGQTRMILSRLLDGRGHRIGRCWDHVEYPKKHWWDIPEVMERWNLMMSGNPGIDYFTYFFEKYLTGNGRLAALTLGCGTGHKELMLAEKGSFDRIDAYDLSKARIEHAREQAVEKGCAAVVNYAVGDVFTVDFSSCAYDVAIVEQSLHHFSPLEEILKKINGSLKTDGFFIFNEFVGPSRFQWTRVQLDMVNNLLARLPERYRVQWKSGTLKKRVHRPGRLSMMLYDATEAVESGRILPLIRDIFNVVEIRGYGGNILQLLFRDIAQNFLPNDPETQGYLRMCFEEEDKFLSREGIEHDFVVGICSKRASNGAVHE
jgi:SAM-dependent methyltransferase